MKGHLYQRGQGGAVPVAVLLVAVLVLAAPPAGAESSDHRPVTVDAVDLAAVKVFPGGVDLAPKVRYERAVLTVTGMGRAFVLEFDSHSQPTIGPFDPSGELLADGVYRWELQLVPNEMIAKRLRESAANNGGVPQRPWLPKSGSFAVQGGIIAMPDALEEGARRPQAPARFVRRADVPAQQYAGQVVGGQKAGREAAVDTDERVAGGFNEVGLLKAARATGPRPRAERTNFRSSQTGPDSDRQAAETGATAERPLVAIPKAHEINQPNPRPRSDGANGRSRSDR